MPTTRCKRCKTGVLLDDGLELRCVNCGHREDPDTGKTETDTDALQAELSAEADRILTEADGEDTPSGMVRVCASCEKDISDTASNRVRCEECAEEVVQHRAQTGERAGERAEPQFVESAEIPAAHSNTRQQCEGCGKFLPDAQRNRKRCDSCAEEAKTRKGRRDLNAQKQAAQTGEPRYCRGGCGTDLSGEYFKRVWCAECAKTRSHVKGASAALMDVLHGKAKSLHLPDAISPQGQDRYEGLGDSHDGLNNLLADSEPARAVEQQVYTTTRVGVTLDYLREVERHLAGAHERILDEIIMASDRKPELTEVLDSMFAVETTIATLERAAVLTGDSTVDVAFGQGLVPADVPDAVQYHAQMAERKT